MADNPYILSKNDANFICRTNGDIIINKVNSPKSHHNKKIRGDWNKFSEPYLCRKWRPSKLRGYVTDEFIGIEFLT